MTEQQRLESALCATHGEIHDLLRVIAERIDEVDPDTADWGHIGDFNRVVRQLHEVLADLDGTGI